jgi:ABC-2 type transport system ATP-binding protein
LIVADEIVVVQGLLKQYKSVTALDGLSLVVRRGEIYGLLGPNGAGKTTAIQILMGVLTPSGGDVGVFGLSPFKDRHRLAGRVNFSSAYVQLPFNLSVGQNLDIFARLYGVPDRAAKIASLLESFRLADKAKARTGSLSSGEQTRLNLCKALLNDPELLFLDEPTASLDPRHRGPGSDGIAGVSTAIGFDHRLHVPQYGRGGSPVRPGSVFAPGKGHHGGNSQRGGQPV